MIPQLPSPIPETVHPSPPAALPESGSMEGRRVERDRTMLGLSPPCVDLAWCPLHVAGLPAGTPPFGVLSPEEGSLSP